ncbi:MAG: coenzyme F420-0:L-glutamate ligase [Spirochaetota bacterium]
MIVEAVHTRRVTAGDLSLEALIDESIASVEPGSVIAITSKVVALCEGRVVDPARVDKTRVIEEEADSYLPRSSNRYHVCLTIKDNVLIPSSGVDESNTGGMIVLWPEDAQRAANDAWRHLVERFGTHELGVIVTDSTSAPLRMGVSGIAIAHAGFCAVNDLVGTADLFGRPLAMTRSNVAAGLAAAAVTVMGEGAEQTPLAVIRELPFVEFQRRLPTDEELTELIIPPEDDLYAPILGSAEWRRGGGGYTGGER